MVQMAVNGDCLSTNAVQSAIGMILCLSIRLSVCDAELNNASYSKSVCLNKWIGSAS